jgi:hypothetical protein
MDSQAEDEQIVVSSGPSILSDVDVHSCFDGCN